MIKISHIHIKRFRSIMDLKLPIDNINNLITICGENNAGKTNVLRALNLFFNSKDYDYKKDTPFHKLEGSRGGNTYPEITIEFIEGMKKFKITKKFNLNEFDLSGKELTTNVEIEIKQIENFLNKIHFFYIESINVSYPKLINNLIDTVFEVAYSNTRFSGAKAKLKEAYEEYNSGLLEILGSLSHDINPLFQEYRDNWQVEFLLDNNVQKFRDIITDDIEFSINDNSNKHIDSKGSGLQRLAYILLHFKIIEKLKKNTILLIDEPDIFLHQSLQKTLYSHIKSTLNNGQVILTTHSPIFINTYSLNNVFLLGLEITEKFYVRKNRTFNELKTKLVDISSVNGDLKIKQYIGIDNKDFDLLSNFNILVEGQSDILYLTELGRYFDLDIPNIIPLGGADNVIRELAFYNNFYHELDSKPKILVLFDNDNAGRTAYDKIVKNKSKNHYSNLEVVVELLPNFLGENTKETSRNNEMEDFVYPEVIVELFNKILSKKSMKKVSAKKTEKNIQMAAFTKSGILNLIENYKNEQNPVKGGEISIISEGVKTTMSKSFIIEGNSKLIKMIEENNERFPEVRSYLEKLLGNQL